MLAKRITIIVLVCILLSLIGLDVFASVYNVIGFGNYYIYQDPNNGQIIVKGQTAGSNIKNDRNKYIGQFDMLFARYGKTITWITGVATMTLVAVFVILCVKNAFMASEHWIIKRQTMTSMLWVGVGAALMGSSTLILIIFQNLFV